jgi:hypothetical protein
VPVIDISIVVLTTGDLERAHRVVDAFAASGIENQLKAQFVYLLNRKDLSFPLDQTATGTRAGVETVYIGNDRYFGSCEENLFRLRDVVDILKPLVLIIGETDEINWPNLAEAARLSSDEHLDAVLLNIQNIQNKRSGGTANMFVAQQLNEDSLQNTFCRSLMNGRTLSTSVAYPAVASMYGPIDWLAFIGNHLYSRTTLRGILKYRFTEHVYSFVYMQALYFAEHSGRYRMFMPETVNRISNDFVSENSQKMPALGWLREHRTVNGQSETLWIANVFHLLQIEDDHLFALLAMSLNLAHTPSGNDDGITFVRNSMVRQIMHWINAVLYEKFNGTSFYLKGQGRGRLDDEIWAIHRFLKRLVTSAPAYEGSFCPAFVEKIDEATIFTSLYFKDVEQSAEVLREASAAVSAALSVLTDEVLRHFQTRSFRHYANRQPN